MNTKTKLIISTLISIATLTLATALVTATPTVSIVPPIPTAQSTINIQAITDPSVTQTNILISECTGNICSITKNYTTTQHDNIFSTDITLTIQDATYLQYTILTYDPNTGWQAHNTNTRVNYTTQSTIEPSQPTPNPPNIPAFTLPIQIIAIALAITLIAFIRKQSSMVVR